MPVSSATAAPPSQQAIRAWFDQTYRSKGLDYLREAEFYAIFMHYLGVREGDRLLDVGCGPGLLLSRAVARGARAWGVDLSASAVAMARELAPGAHVSASNAQSLPFADGSFDHLTCIGTFEHFLDGAVALAEFRRVLANSGRICIMVPNSRTVKWQLERRLGVHDPDSHERAATLEYWRSVFEGNDFQVEALHRDEWPRYSRRRRLLGAGRGFVEESVGARHLLPLRFANQFVFVLRPLPGASG